jgi:hypothetical protein
MRITQVPEPKTAKNRQHLDRRAPADMAEEVARPEAPGATVARRDAALTVMPDPEGNEFLRRARTGATLAAAATCQSA